MYLFKHQNGFYYIIYKNSNNKKSRISTKSKLKSEAHTFLGEFTNQLVERKRKGHNTIDLKSFIRDYSAHSEAVHRPKTVESLKWVFKDFQKFFGNPLLHEITLQQIQSYLNFKRKVSIYTGQKHLAYLRSAFNYAVKHEYLLKNYFNEIPNYRIPQKQPIVITKEEFQLLLSSINEKWFMDIVEIGYNTGMRQMEILNLRWNQIDFEKNSIVLNNQEYINKSKRVRTIYLTNRAKEILVRLNNVMTCNLVFHNNNVMFKQDHISKKFKKHVRRVHINQLIKFHSLRGSFATNLLMRNVNPRYIQLLLGHQNLSTTLSYLFVGQDDLKESINKLNEG